ncbi:MAG: hypothetical protein HDP28_03155 [Clostridia bacterium]|nr:hypothetical protein [Clostridia bacterium]
MGKVKSAICIVLTTLLIAVMCFFCTVSFKLNDIETFHSTVSLTGKDITLGNEIDEDNYIGGGYVTTYYPEGVISAKEYEDNLAAYETAYKEADSATDNRDADKVAELLKRVNDYKAKYPEALKRGSLYLEKEIASEDEGKTISDSFKTKIEKTFKIAKERYEALHIDGMKIEVLSDYALRVTLPQIYSASSYAFQNMAYMGELTVAVGSDASTATTIFPEKKKDAVIGDYLKSFSTRTSADGTHYVGISFTSLGREVIKEQTASAESSSTTLFIKVGDNVPVQFSVSSQIDQSTTYISGSFTGESAKATSVLLNSALKYGDAEDLTVSYGDTILIPATYGGNALMLVYIAFAVTIVAMAVFFFVRYGLLGFAYLFTYLLFLFSMLLCIWAIPFLYISVGSVLGLLLASVVLGISSALPYEYARKEYALGRTMTASVKSAYKKTFWHVFDLHVVLAALAFIIYGISLTGLSTFAFTFGLGIGFSAICSLLVGRLQWASMMSFTSKKGNFCRFKREEVEDDD